jgi:putative endonuclease
MGMRKQYYVYILTNKHHAVLYTGVTGDLQKRVYQHRMKLVPGFTSRYNVYKLVFYEVADNPEAAILREKQIKGGSRQKKIDLINAMNRNGRTCMRPSSRHCERSEAIPRRLHMRRGRDCFVAYGSSQ